MSRVLNARQIPKGLREAKKQCLNNRILVSRVLIQKKHEFLFSYEKTQVAHPNSDKEPVK